MDFTSITTADMESAVVKFRNAGARVAITNSPVANPLSYEEMALMTDTVSIPQLRKALINQGRKIMTVPNDAVLGDVSYAFTCTDGAGRRVKFSNQEVYLVIRAALLKRKEDIEYQTKIKEARRLKAFLNDNKSQEEKLKEAKEAFESLGIDESEL